MTDCLIHYPGECDGTGPTCIPSVTVAKESRADVEVSPVLIQHKDIFFDGSSLDPERMRVEHLRHVLAKIWAILADGERALDPDADPEFDTNDVYDLVRKGTEARKKIVEGERTIKEFIASRTEEALVEFDVTIKAVNAALDSQREHYAEIADRYADFAVENNDAHNIALDIRSGK